MIINRTSCACVLALCAVAGNGCMTSALWKDELIESYHEPSSPNQLALFCAPGGSNVLVRYDELSPWRDTPHPRVYCLKQER